MTPTLATFIVLLAAVARIPQQGQPQQTNAMVPHASAAVKAPARPQVVSRRIRWSDSSNTSIKYAATPPAKTQGF